MAKYSYKFKKKVVLEYLNGEGGMPYLSKKYGLGNHSQLQRWIAAYNEFGDEGLFRSREKKDYSFEKKLSVVELYLSGEISYQELALQEGMANPTLIAAWVRRFREGGPDALRPQKKGRKKTVDKPDNNTQNTSADNTGIDTSVEHVRELEEEIFRLRLENDFLKELRRLRLEDEARTRERLGSSAASEDDTN